MRRINKMLFVLVFLLLFTPQITFAKEKVITICKNDKIPLNLTMKDLFFMQLAKSETDSPMSLIRNMEPGEEMSFPIASLEEIMEGQQEGQRNKRSISDLYLDKEIIEGNQEQFSDFEKSNRNPSEEILINLYNIVVKDVDSITIRMEDNYCPVDNLDIDLTSVDKFLDTNMATFEMMMVALERGEFVLSPLSEMINSESQSGNMEDALSNLELYRNNKLLARINLFEMDIKIMDDVTFADNFHIDLEKVLSEAKEDENNHIPDEQYQRMLSIVRQAGNMNVKLREAEKPQVVNNNPLTSENIWIILGSAIVVIITLVLIKKKEKVKSN